MANVEEITMVAFEIISNVGMAKSQYLQALSVAKEGNYDQAKELIAEADKMQAVGHKAHAGLVTKEASEQVPQITLILAHAEDQLMASETIKIMVEELIHLHQKIK